MEKIIVIVTTTILSGIGWWLGAFVGIFTAFTLSIVGTGFGVYFGRKFVRDYLP